MDVVLELQQVVRRVFKEKGVVIGDFAGETLAWLLIEVETLGDRPIAHRFPLGQLVKD